MNNKMKLLFILLVFFIFYSCESRNLCSDNFFLPCLITRGPSNSHVYSSDERSTKEFSCQFSEAANENFISNYKWYIDGRYIGIVNKNSIGYNWEVTYNEKLKTSFLKISKEHLSFGEHIVSCKYPNLADEKRPMEEKNAKFFAIEKLTEEEDVLDDGSGNENTSTSVATTLPSETKPTTSSTIKPTTDPTPNPPSIILENVKKNVSWSMSFTNLSSCNFTMELNSNITKELGDLGTFYNQTYIDCSSSENQYEEIKVVNALASYNVTLEGDVSKIKQADRKKFEKEIAAFAKRAVNITLEGKNVSNKDVIEKSIKKGLEDNLQEIKDKSCTIDEVSNKCCKRYEKCVDDENSATCQDKCKNECKGSNRVCFINNEKPQCTCKDGYVKFGSKRCVKPAVFYGILGGSVGAIILILVIVIIVLCVRSGKKKKPEEIRRIQTLTTVQQTSAKQEIKKDEPKSKREQERGIKKDQDPVKLREKRTEEVRTTTDARDEIPKNNRYDDFRRDDELDKRDKETPIIYPIVPIDARGKGDELNRRYSKQDDRPNKYQDREYDEIDDRGRRRNRLDSSERIYTGDPTRRRSSRDDYNEGRVNRGYAPDRKKDDDIDSWIGLDEYVSSRQSALARPQLRRQRYDSSPRSLERRPMRSDSDRNMSRSRYNREYYN